MLKIPVVATSLALTLAAGAQRATARQAAPAVADSAGVTGKYDLSFLPRNGEAITAGLTIALRGGRYYGVVTSPKLSEPADADEVRVAGHHVFVSVLGGAYTFSFDVEGKAATHGTYTKAMQGATEQGELTIRKAGP